MALKEIFLIIWLIYFVQYVYCNGGAIFGKKYLEASEWTPTIETHIRLFHIPDRTTKINRLIF